ncbi:MAG: PUR family DNA/RNA-binding protein [Bacteroidales bacterium]|nr:DUF3276 family protein [Bacteroidales bacterium]MBO7346439.1 DUF3276 family protein [Bacteroidales bacterium]MBQ4478680.1 DUF3276 family protein [Bacteroidales bacterium]MCR5555033.1 PUR family DNA/RNA-binding protein [Bacteroidales bacterium]
MMDSFENKEDKEQVERKELFSKRVRCGRRTYFFDVKSSKNNEPYLAITESKRCLNENNGDYFFEKNKIFISKYDIMLFHDELGKIIDQMKVDKLISEEEQRESSSDL